MPPQIKGVCRQFVSKRNFFSRHRSVYHSSGVLAAAVMILFTIPSSAVPAPGPLLYSSADYNGTIGGGQGILASQWEGVRFQLNGNATIGAIGGNIGTLPFAGNGELFGALIQLSSMSDFPDSITLNTPDVLATVTFTSGNPSVDVVAPVGPINVGPGTYGVVIGTGLFGATGQGYMTVGNPQTVTPSLFGNYSGAWFNAAPTTFRFTVYAVPEPTAGALLALGFAGGGLRFFAASKRGRRGRVALDT
jgi:hypothetical protein